MESLALLGTEMVHTSVSANQTATDVNFVSPLVCS